MIHDEHDIHFMRLALEEAYIAFDMGEVPVGAVLVMDNHIIARSHNSREVSNDPSGHAEILALREGARGINNWRMTDATLFVTKEPCVMCAGAMVNARLGRLVYSCKDNKGGGVDSLYHILTDKRLNHQVEVVSGLLEHECADLLRKFFQQRR